MRGQRTSRGFVHYLNVFATTITTTLAAVAMTVVLAQPAQTQTYSVIYNLTTGTDVLGYEGGMILNNGSLFGTVWLGGIQGYCCGEVFELTSNASGWAFLPLYYFNGHPDGYAPLEISFGPDGNIYGTTDRGPIAASVFSDQCGGGGFGCGTVFQLEPSKRNLGAWGETVLYTFRGGSDGAFPNGSLAFDGAGNIYGMAGGGGDYGGVVYELARSGDGWRESVIHQFSWFDENGGRPSGGLIIDREGNLYGTTEEGGDLSKCNSYGCGTVFQLVPSVTGWTENVLYRFEDGADGSGPQGGLAFDNAGNLYGTTAGVWSNDATVFELTHSEAGWTLTTLHNFGGSGQGSKLTVDAAGSLYGVSWQNETLYKMTRSNDGWIYTDVHLFTCDTGCGPFGKLALGANGEIYGITAEGGTFGYGVVYEITP